MVVGLVTLGALVGLVLGVGLAMLLQQVLPLKRLPALPADKVSRLRVENAVLLQIAGLLKPFPTDVADVRLFPRMNEGVSLKVGGFDEGLTTDARVPPLPSVDLAVVLQGAGAGKTFTALGADVGFHSCMRPLVSFQILGPVVAFRALDTAVLSLGSRMVLRVLLELPRLSKAFSAVFAHKRFLTGVRQLVSLEIAGLDEPFLAVRASIYIISFSPI